MKQKLTLIHVLKEISACSYCKDKLPFDPRPILSIHQKSRILLIGQAPGIKVHESGIPWKDASGDRLRKWLGVDLETFYDNRIFGILPMGFCYPGKNSTGDLPPRPECQPLWHDKVRSHLRDVQLIVLIGKYSQDCYLGEKQKESLTATVKAWQSYLPKFFPLPHPSPRNRIWLSKNKWFESNTVPQLQTIVRKMLKSL